MFKGTIIDGDQMDWGPTKYGEQLQRDSEKYHTQDLSQSSITMSNS
jgi:O-acetylhomoserine/O-acetylserine sulfhydrylase-like pyridoxal-dependent enzyme